MVILHTNHGDITLELDAENAPATVANFLQYVRDGHYDNTIFHRVIDGFMIQGGGMEPGMKQKPVRAPIANEAGNGLKNKRYTVAMARTSDPHSATAQFFINVADNDFLDHKGPSPQGWGYCVFGKVTGGQDVVDKIKGVPTGNERLPPERAEDGRRDRARRGSRIKPDAVRFRPSPVAGAAGAGRRVRSVLRGSGARGRRRSTCWATSSTSGSATTSCASRSPRASRPRLRGVADVRRPGRDHRRQPRLPARPALRRGRGRDAAAGADRRRPRRHADAADARRRAVHRRRRVPALPRVDARPGAPAPLPRAARTSCGAAIGRLAARQEPQPRPPSSPKRSWTSSADAVDAAFRDARRRADDPRPHAPAGAPPTRSSTAARCERYVLADWYDRGSYLEVDADGGRRATRSRPCAAVQGCGAAASSRDA